MKDHDGVTALMNAAESGSLVAVQALVEKGADAGAMSTTAFTPLIVAAAGGHFEVVKVRKMMGLNKDFSTFSCHGWLITCSGVCRFLVGCLYLTLCICPREILSGCSARTLLT